MAAAVPAAGGEQPTKAYLTDSTNTLREVNKSKVAHMLSYLEDVSYGGVSNASVPEEEEEMQHRYAEMDSDANGTTRTGRPSLGPLSPAPLNRANSSVASLPSSVAHSDAGASCEQQRQASSSCSTRKRTPAVVECLAAPPTTYMGIKQKIESLQFEKDEALRDNAALRQRLAEARKADAQRKEELQHLIGLEAEDLRRELVETQRRYHERVDKLEAEREDLMRQVHALSYRLRDELRSREEEREKMEAANSAALSALKGRWQMQEKAARERWRIAESRRIKESTLQSLEPDIVLLLNRHKAEKARQREEFEAELRARDEIIAAKDASVDELRAKLRREAEEVLTREQRANRTALEEEVERVRRQLDEERRSSRAKCEEMTLSFDTERQRLQAEVAQLTSQALELRRQQTLAQASLHETIAKEVARLTGESHEQLAGVKDRLMLEVATREREVLEQNARRLEQREAELRQQMATERDAAIAHVVSRLKEEHLQAMAAVRGSDSALRDRHAQLQRDHARLTTELELAQQQLQAAIAARRSVENELSRLRAEADFSQERVRAIEARVAARLQAETEIRDSERQKQMHMMDARRVAELAEAADQREALSRKLVEAQAAHAAALREQEEAHHAALNQLNDRLLVALTRKENTIETLNQQIESLKEAVAVRDEELRRHLSLIQ